MRNLTPWQKTLFVVMLVMLIVALPVQRVRANDTCIQTYEKALIALDDTMKACYKAAWDNSSIWNPGGFVIDAAMCHVEWESNAVEAGLKYTSCMTLDVLFKGGTPDNQ